MFYHFADPVVRNLLTASEYDDYDVEKLADHIATFSLAAIEATASAGAAGADAMNWIAFKMLTGNRASTWASSWASPSPRC